MKPKPISRLRTDFFTGLAVVLPAVISIAVVVWLFGTVANITNTLLFAVPREWKYVNGARGDIHWYWSLAALGLAIALITLVGRFARHYLGRKLIETGDNLLLRLPLLNKIYSTVKPVKEAFAGNKSSFKEAVLVDSPHPGIYSLGFITSQQRNELQIKTPEQVSSVFVPTTPNPTTGFLSSSRNAKWSGSICRSLTPSRPSSVSAGSRPITPPECSRQRRWRQPDEYLTKNLPPV